MPLDSIAIDENPLASRLASFAVLSQLLAPGGQLASIQAPFSPCGKQPRFPGNAGGCVLS